MMNDPIEHTEHRRPPLWAAIDPLAGTDAAEERVPPASPERAAPAGARP